MVILVDGAHAVGNTALAVNVAEKQLAGIAVPGQPSGNLSVGPAGQVLILVNGQAEGVLGDLGFGDSPASMSSRVNRVSTAWAFRS